MLLSSCETIKGVGPKLASQLHKCGIYTVSDLLFHLPYRYQDRTRITPICDVRLHDYCVISGRICKIEIKPGKRPALCCYLQDKTGILCIRFFHFPFYLQARLEQGGTILAFGAIRSFKNQWEMIHPEYQLKKEEEPFCVEEYLTPLYSSTAGLSQFRIRQLIQQAFSYYHQEIDQLEWMSRDELHTHQLPSMANALRFLHAPTPDTSLLSLENRTHPALRRLILDELIAGRISIAFARAHKRTLCAPSMQEGSIIDAFLAQLPYALTDAQTRVLAEIRNDLMLPRPMTRLLQGDVGSGKTTVAALASLQAIGAGYQVILMAPTELLSEQHANTFQRWFAPLGIPCQRLSSKMKRKEKEATLSQLKDGTSAMVIGTHALLQESVLLANVGLIIIDEQHRFGVEQRLLLQQKARILENKKVPHQLFMTATPIPRTLAMTRFAHLDISIIDALPPGRMPIQTRVLQQERREELIQKLQSALAQKKQIYWVCTLIEESEKLQCMAASITQENLQHQLPETTIGLIHGRMKPQEKEAVMQAFQQGHIHLLVATTVIEVGVDVPNASVMIIENAERLGLAQLHQLRGRVGRGSLQSYCLLLYQSPLSTQASLRLQILRSTNDGFLIAEKDLEIRGAGEVLGTKQTGYTPWRIANMQGDLSLLPLANTLAKTLLQKQPLVAKEVATRWLGEFEAFLQG